RSVFTVSNSFVEIFLGTIKSIACGSDFFNWLEKAVGSFGPILKIAVLRTKSFFNGNNSDPFTTVTAASAISWIKALDSVLFKSLIRFFVSIGRYWCKFIQYLASNILLTLLLTSSFVILFCLMDFFTSFIAL